MFKTSLKSSARVPLLNDLNAIIHDYAYLINRSVAAERWGWEVSTSAS
jgi:hypothetical protein